VLVDGSLDLAGLEDSARQRLSSFKVPRRWALLGSADDVPLMATGKVDKPGLQQLVRTACRLGRSGGPTTVSWWRKNSAATPRAR
jgi:acyl-CoA synthetase (AMP-forming)/AMP-acid ligase II